MWSDRYNYYNIRYDEDYSVSISTEIVFKILAETNYLKKQEKSIFINNDEFPWISITCAYTLNGNFSSNNLPVNCNLLSVVTSKGNKEDEEKYISLLSNIASVLNWELILEDDEDGNENKIIYRPNKLSF